MVDSKVWHEYVAAKKEDAGKMQQLSSFFLSFLGSMGGSQSQLLEKNLVVEAWKGMDWLTGGFSTLLCLLSVRT